MPPTHRLLVARDGHVRLHRLVVRAALVREAPRAARVGGRVHHPSVHAPRQRHRTRRRGYLRHAHTPPHGERRRTMPPSPSSGGGSPLLRRGAASSGHVPAVRGGAEGGAGGHGGVGGVVRRWTPPLRHTLRSRRHEQGRGVGCRGRSGWATAKGCEADPFFSGSSEGSHTHTRTHTHALSHNQDAPGTPSPP